MRNVFNHYRIDQDYVIADTLFIPGEKLSNLPISTPFTFPIFKNKVVLAKDKMNWWNPLGGHIFQGESWKEALTREAYEEAGIKIDNIRIFGYIKVTKLLDHPNNQYPPLSQIPMTVSNVVYVDKKWQPQETFARTIVTYAKAEEMLKQRTDNQQMWQILQYLKSLRLV